MARIPYFYGYSPQSDFLLGKTSKFSPEAAGIKYYQKTRHTRDQGSLQEKFLASFDTQVYPTILPGALFMGSPTPIGGIRILSEISQFMLTELGGYLIIE